MSSSSLSSPTNTLSLIEPQKYILVMLMKFSKVRRHRKNILHDFFKKMRKFHFEASKLGGVSYQCVLNKNKKSIK